MKKGKDLVIKSHMIVPLSDYETEKVANFMDKINRASVAMFKKKDADYDGSWQNRGLFSIQSNFERKVDRVNSQFYGQITVGESGENVADTLIDLSNYSNMYAYYLYMTDSSVKKQIDEFLQSYLED